MKKKFLSLMMAAAVVATTSVSAFASTQTSTQNITGPVNAEKEAQVTVEGKVADNEGHLPTGVYNVTIPSKVAFSVDEHGKFTGVELPIENNGDDAIKIKVSKFVDTDGDDTGIKLNTTEDLSDKVVRANKGRNEINLTLQGNLKKVFLGHNKVLDRIGGSSVTEEIADVDAKGTRNLQLSGYAGGANLGQGVSAITNEFTLTFEISKK